MSSFVEAQRACERVLEAAKAQTGSIDAFVCQCWDLLGFILRYMGNSQQAYEAAISCLNARVANLPANHPDIGVALNNAAQCEKDVGR